MLYEKLLEECNTIAPVIECDLLNNTGYEGLYRNGFILIEKSLPITKKIEILIEEKGHHLTSIGDIRDENIIENSKQETKARSYAYEQLLTLDTLIDLRTCGLTEYWQFADELNVTPEFIHNALDHIKSKYGTLFTYDDYQFIFDYHGQLQIEKNHLY